MDALILKIFLFFSGSYSIYNGYRSIKSKKAHLVLLPGFKGPAEDFKMVGNQARINGILFLFLGVGLIVLSLIYR